ncbi:N-acetylmuramoyl-L-alanine amidase [Bacillota bacterium LX-D]|nr:N-acetylmuramoyl-L-alanine amidase [Bacillota bacterium LX-D]
MIGRNKALADIRKVMQLKKYSTRWFFVLTVLLCNIFFGTVLVNAYAAGENVRITVNDKEIQADVQPYIDNQNRTMVSIRVISQELGYSVEWNSQAQEVTVRGQGTTIKLWVGKTESLVNGRQVTLDTTATLKDGRVMVPLRFIMESLGVSVNYNNQTRVVSIVQKDKGQENVEVIPVSGKVAQVSGSVVNIRSGPGTNYAVKTKVYSGQKLDVLGQNKSGDWYQVAVANNNAGWIAGSLVTLRSEGDTSSRTPEPGENSQTDTDTSDEELVSIENISVDTTGNDVTFTVTASGKLNYSTFRLDNPRRLVVDFPNSVLKLSEQLDTISVNQGLVKSIRVGQYSVRQSRITVDITGAAGIALASSANNSSKLTFKVEKPSLKGKTIVIDPGHGSIQSGGSSDPGARGPSGLFERDVVLNVSLKVKELLEAKGAKVIMTRTGNTYLTLKGRAEVANKNNAQIFVCIHCNASTSRSANGTATYYYAQGSLSTQREIRQRLASTVQEQLVKAIGRKNRGIVEANFAVLRYTNVPSILVETAFISNYEEEALLAKSDFQDKIAVGITNGIEKYFME